MTESECNVRVFTMDNGNTVQNNSHPRLDRHFDLNVGHLNGLRKVRKEVVYSQIMLDFVWFLPYYWKTKLGPNFFPKVIPHLTEWLGCGGKIFLPVCSNFFVQIVRNWSMLVQLYRISFLSEVECGGIHICRGTSLLDKSKFHVHLGKLVNQIGLLSISDVLIRDECNTELVSYDTAKRIFLQIKKPDQHTEHIRLICFLKIDENDESV